MEKERQDNVLLVRLGTMVAAASVLLAGCAGTQTQTGSSPYRAEQAESQNMRLVGFIPLQARSAYQPELHRHGNRVIAYVGHHGGPAKVNPLNGQNEFNGTSIIDVTDPARPRYLAHIAGQEGGTESGGAQMVRICDGSSLPKGDRSKVYMLRSFGNSAHEVWDVTNPEKPVFMNALVKGLRDTHKNWWECDSGIAYLVSGVKGWKTRRMTQVFDLSDPAKPVHVRDFGLPGQEPGSKSTEPDSFYALHGAISTGPKGNRLYLGYGTVSNGVIQILDREKLLKGAKEPTPQGLLEPQIARINTPLYWGAHTTLPVLGIPMPGLAQYTKGPKHRDIIVVVNESTSNECQEPRQQVYIVDITEEARPFPISNFDVPEKPGSFCSRGGRFGSHGSNERMPPVYDKRVVFVTYFNAGVRAVDIRDPYNPKEIGYYIPAITAETDRRCIKTADGQERCKIVIQTNNVEVDDRGYIYVVDRANTGMHILELTGTAREAANFK
ncbi:MAG TPA: hypothetical protein VKF40_29875 [Burkholderiales bacterium]|nr:hypothetical protein [Burkholderiales bacterium]